MVMVMVMVMAVPTDSVTALAAFSSRSSFSCVFLPLKFVEHDAGLSNGCRGRRRFGHFGLLDMAGPFPASKANHQICLRLCET